MGIFSSTPQSSSSSNETEKQTLEGTNNKKNVTANEMANSSTKNTTTEQVTTDQVEKDQQGGSWRSKMGIPPTRRKHHKKSSKRRGHTYRKHHTRK